MKTFRLDIFSTKEEIREMEQELSRKYGERCVVLPAYMNPKEQKGAKMNDLISRQAAVDMLNDDAELLRRVLDDVDVVGASREKYEWGLGLIESCIYDIKELPSAQEERRMRLTKEEQEICKKFRKRDENNTVHCFECPLVIDRLACLCKRNSNATNERSEDEET